MAALSTVSQYVTSARVLLNDTVVPYRYPDADLVSALSFALLEARKLRPDLFIGRSDDVPYFSTNDSTAVDFDIQYRVPVLYYIVGQAQLRDEEDTQDARAAGLMTTFTQKLLGLQ